MDLTHRELRPRMMSVAYRMLGSVVDIAGPEPIRMDDFVRRFLSARGETKRIEIDPEARDFGSPIDDRSRVSHGESLNGPTCYNDWLARDARSDHLP